MLYRLFLVVCAFMAVSLGMFGAGFIWLPHEFINIEMLGKYMLVWSGLWLILVATALNRDYNSYWAEQDRKKAERARLRDMALQIGRLKGLWP